MNGGGATELICCCYVYSTYLFYGVVDDGTLQFHYFLLCFMFLSLMFIFHNIHVCIPDFVGFVRLRFTPRMNCCCSLLKCHVQIFTL